MNLPILHPDHLAGLVFLIMIATTILGGLLACNAERLVRAVAGLIVCFVGVSGLYFFLNAPFVAMIQILIYVGAVAITISFAIMLASPEVSKKPGSTSILAGPFGIITAALLFSGFAFLAVHTNWQSHPKTNTGSISEIGTQLLTTYSMVFELISIVLLVAIIGALLLARRGRSK